MIEVFLKSIRIVVMVTIISASFALMWFLYDRLAQVTTIVRSNTTVREVNLPRLEKDKLSTVSVELNKRTFYSGGVKIQIPASEKDPFVN